MERNDIETLESRIGRVESLLIVLTIGAIASGDYLFGPSVSLGYLYLIPLSYSALAHRWPTTLALITVCVVLRQLLGPIQLSSWSLIARDWILTAIFLSVVTALQRLGRARRRFFDTARQQRDELVREVELAAGVQQQLMSRHIPPTDSLEIVVRMQPARGVGGDYYDFVQLDDGRLAVVIADVSGKGLPAALLMPAVQISLRTLVSRYESVDKIAEELNRVLFEGFEQATYVTLFLGFLDFESNTLTYCNAGHQPVLLVRARGNEASWLSDGGTPLGLLAESTYQSGKVDLAEGDLLLFYTDGVAEAHSPDDELFGNERLKEIVTANFSTPVAGLVEEIHAEVGRFCAGAVLEDDATVIAVRYQTERQQPSVLRSASSHPQEA